jgi:hypothetical protein
MGWGIPAWQSDPSASQTYGHFKSIVRTRCLGELGMHNHRLAWRCRLLALPAAPFGPLSLPALWRYPAVELRYPPLIDERSLADSALTPLHLNHYPIQSLSWFMAIKASRGDASTMGLVLPVNFRGYSYYVRYNRSEVLDEGLAHASRRATGATGGAHPLGRCLREPPR